MYITSFDFVLYFFLLIAICLYLFPHNDLYMYIFGVYLPILLWTYYSYF